MLQFRKLRKDLDGYFETNWTTQINEEMKQVILCHNNDWEKWNSSHFLKKLKKGFMYKHSLRALTLQSTIHICRSGKYRFTPEESEKGESKGKEVVVCLDKKDLCQSSIGTKFFGNDHQYQWEKDLKKLSKKVEIEIVNGDCVDAAHALKEDVKQRVALLNMANRYSPGGDWPMRSNTQEENLHRRSSLYMCLDDIDKVDSDRKWNYPIEEFGCIFSPEVTFFRAGESEGYRLSSPRTLGVITAAAYSSPPTFKDEKTNSLRFKPQTEKKVIRKLINIFNACLENGYRNVVLSAFGSGAFSNPPGHMAELFKFVIEKHFKDYFHKIVFAIIDDRFAFRKWNEEGNLKPFEKVFSQKAKTVKFQY